MLRETQVCFIQHQNTEKAQEGNEEEVLQEKNTDLPASEGSGGGAPPQGFALRCSQGKWSLEYGSLQIEQSHLETGSCIE